MLQLTRIYVRSCESPTRDQPNQRKKLSWASTIKTVAVPSMVERQRLTSRTVDQRRNGYHLLRPTATQVHQYVQPSLTLLPQHPPVFTNPRRRTQTPTNKTARSSPTNRRRIITRVQDRATQRSSHQRTKTNHCHRHTQPRPSLCEIMRKRHNRRCKQRLKSRSKDAVERYKRIICGNGGNTEPAEEDY
jgi:hypothetical protein